jgi:hypothetical protein
MTATIDDYMTDAITLPPPALRTRSLRNASDSMRRPGSHPGGWRALGRKGAGHSQL